METWVSQEHALNTLVLEAEPRLKSDGATAKRNRVLPKVRGGHICGDLPWIEVQDVEEVECIGADFDPRVFAEKSGVRKAETLAERSIDIAVIRSDERIPQ